MQEVDKREDIAGVRLYVEKNNQIAQKVYEAMGMQKTIYHMYEVGAKR